MTANNKKYIADFCLENGTKKGPQWKGGNDDWWIAMSRDDLLVTDDNLGVHFSYHSTTDSTLITTMESSDVEPDPHGGKKSPKMR